MESRWGRISQEEAHGKRLRTRGFFENLGPSLEVRGVGSSNLPVPTVSTKGREITWSEHAEVCDVNCDVQAQSPPANPNKFNAGAFTFRAGSLSCYILDFSGLG